jgi:hypothetical protein
MVIDGKQRMYWTNRYGICEHWFYRIYKHSKKLTLSFIKLEDFLEQLIYSVLGLLQYLPSPTESASLLNVTAMSHRNTVYLFILYFLSV